jgi:hypothetical protein
MDKQPTKEEISVIKEMSGPIGLIVLQWSYVERNMDYILKIIAEDYDTKKFITIKTLSPFSGKKISLLRKCFNQLPSLGSFKKDGKSLMKRAETISKKRNQLIHSTFDGINPDGSINFLSLTRPKGELKYIFNRFVYTVPTLFDLDKKIEVLARDIGLFGLTLRPKKS